MEEGLVHYYNVIFGKCVCGASAGSEKVSFSVFPEKVTCTNCLNVIRKSEGK